MSIDEMQVLLDALRTNTDALLRDLAPNHEDAAPLGSLVVDVVQAAEPRTLADFGQSAAAVEAYTAKLQMQRLQADNDYLRAYLEAAGNHLVGYADMLARLHRHRDAEKCRQAGRRAIAQAKPAGDAA